MTYFPKSDREERYDPLFLEPIDYDAEDPGEEPAEEDEDALLWEEDARDRTDYRDIADPEEREERLEQRDRMRLASSLVDYVLAFLWLLAAVLIVVLIVQLVNWVSSDLVTRFPVLEQLGIGGGA